jgi:iron complex outermembrane receptor protein
MIKSLPAAFASMFVSSAVVASEASIFDLSLEDLMTIEVNSVARRSQPIATAASAIYVITAEDIQRSGVSTIPDALRIVPGLQVAQIDSNKWAVSARGFNSRLANKLLVLVDGRTVYTPTFSGVYWENVDMPLADIDRIEVIRGPGATLWGSNAVNGVINITTKSAAETRGNLFTSRLDSTGEQVLSLRSGGTLSPSADYRVYAKARRTGDLQAGIPALDNDSMETGRLGFRIDGQQGEASTYTLQGELFRTDITQDYLQTLPGTPGYGQYVKSPVDQHGSHILSRWTHTGDSGNVLTTQFFYDSTFRKEILQNESRKTYDLDVQYQFAPMAIHNIIIGGGYRFERHTTKDTDALSLVPANLNSDLSNFFIQDEMRFWDDRLAFIIGAKFEHNDFSKKSIDIQPNARVTFALNENHNYWAAVSKALRTYSRGERDARLHVFTLPPFSPDNPTPLTLAGFTQNINSLEPEQVKSYEVGYRGRWTENLSVDIAAFRNVYDQLRSTTALDGFTLTPDYAKILIEIDNQSSAVTRGIELAAEYSLSTSWKLSSSYSYIDMEAEFVGAEPATTAPRNQLSVGSQLSIGDNRSLDMWLRYVDRIPDLVTPAYTELDITYLWNISDSLRLSLVGRNLLDRHHDEFRSDIFPTTPMLVQRIVAAQLSIDF